MNLAESIYEVRSVADCFHFKYCINKLLCLSLTSKLRSCRLEADGAKTDGLKKEKAELYAQVQFHNDLYVDSMSNISHILHPFTEGNRINTREQATSAINDELSKIEDVIMHCEIKDKYNLFSKAQNQVAAGVEVIPIWHQIVEEEISQMKLSFGQQEWFRDHLALKYWQQAIKRTKYGPTRKRLKDELQKCQRAQTDCSVPSDMDSLKMEELKQKAIDLCRKFQRASSQVEGRNGHLSLINHNQRGFNESRLEVLTVVHNFDTRGLDNKTPAERLFGHKLKFDSLPDYILENFGELPMPRKRKLTG